MATRKGTHTIRVPAGAKRLLILQGPPKKRKKAAKKRAKKSTPARRADGTFKPKKSGRGGVWGTASFYEGK